MAGKSKKSQSESVVSSVTIKLLQKLIAFAAYSALHGQSKSSKEQTREANIFKMFHGLDGAINLVANFMAGESPFCGVWEQVGDKHILNHTNGLIRTSLFLA